MNITIKLRMLSKCRVHRISGLGLASIILQSLMQLRFAIPEPLDQQIPILSPNSESQLATGQRIRLSQSRLVDLELIPGISDGLGQNLLRMRDKILRDAKPTRELGDCRVLELAHGVGGKTAEKLCLWLEPR